MCYGAYFAGAREKRRQDAGATGGRGGWARPPGDVFYMNVILKTLHVQIV
jgi:hypothetical protein